MKLKRRRASEVPPKIRSFINDIIASPLDSIEEPLKTFVWDFDKGDFHHWVDLFNHFDSYFEKYIKPRKDLRLEDDFVCSDPPFPREAVLQILRVIRIILENCTNKHFYSSHEQHLSSLLACTDPDIVEASLQTLATFLKKTVGKYSMSDTSLNSKLFAFAQGWGGKEEGLGLTNCALENGCDSTADQLGCTLHFEFYAADESSSDLHPKQGLQIIHLSNISSHAETDLELLGRLVKEHEVPPSLRFPLLTRLRYARGFSSLASRQQLTCIRLYAFVVLVQANSDTGNLVSFFNSEPEFINELLSILHFDDAVPEKIRILSLLSLIALCQDRSRQPTVLAAVTSGRHRGILSSLMQKGIDSVLNECSKCSVLFADTLLALVTVLVSSSSGCSAMREAGFMPTLLPLLKDTNPQHLHLVSTAVHVLEAFMDYSNPAAALFRDLGGLDDTISRLKAEVSIVEKDVKQRTEDSDCGRKDGDVGTDSSSAAEDMQPLYSEALVSYHRRLLMKALLRAISLGTYAPGSTTRISGSEESLLPHCLCVIFRRAKDFGGGVFYLAATVMSDLIHKDPTCFSVLDAAGLPSAFMDSITGGVLCSPEAITCIPQCLDALCLNNNGLQAVKDRNALSCFVKIFTSRGYLRALAAETPAALSSGLDELMRHASSLRAPGVDMLIEILNTIQKLGTGIEAPASSSAASLPSHAYFPMDTDAEDENTSSPFDKEQLRKTEGLNPEEPSPDASGNVESFIPDCVNNTAHLLETILQNSDACRMFIEKRGVESVLQIFTLPLLPLSFSVGQSIAVAFKNFSPQHSASLARAVCSFLKEHLSTINELLDSVRGFRLADVEAEKLTKILRSLSSLEGILTLSNSLLKGTTTIISELGADNADVLKDIGIAYREVMWQISLSCDSKVQEKQNADAGTDGAESASNGGGRESDDDAPVLRYMNPVSRRSGSQSQWGGERDFLQVIRSSEGLSRRSRYSLARIRGGRTGRYLDALNTDSDAAANTPDSSFSQESKKKSPDVLMNEVLSKLASTMHSFFTALVKGFSSSNRRRADPGSLGSAAKNIGAGLAKVFLEALSFSGHSGSVGLDMSLSVKCRYLGKVVDDVASLIFDSRRRICYTSVVNNFYVSGAFKEILTTFEATSQLLWTLPISTQASGMEAEKATEGGKVSQNSWLLHTLQSYCRVLEYFVNSSLLLSQTSTAQTQMLVQPVAVGLSIGLFPVPRDPEVFVRMLQSQVVDVILPVWNHPSFPSTEPSFVTSILSLINHVYSGVGDVKRNRSSVAGSTNQHVAPPPDEVTIATIVEMGFSRVRAEEALRRVESNSVEMAMEWLCNHADDPVQDDDEMARALALSLGSSTEASKADNVDKTGDILNDEEQMRTLPIDDIIGTLKNLFQTSDSISFPLTDLLITLCNRNKGEDRPKVAAFIIQQMKLCSSDFTKDTDSLSTIAHILALLLSEDSGTREVAVQNGIISVAIDILTNFKEKNESSSEILSTKCVTALLLILDSLLESKPKISLESIMGTPNATLPDSSLDKKQASDEKDAGFAFEKLMGQSIGHLSVEESRRVLAIACDLLKQHVPSVFMQAVFHLCARLTKTHDLAMQFLECGGMVALFSLPGSSFFQGYDTLASTIVRHLLEDPQTLQTAMELEIRQTLSGSRHARRITTRTFLTSMAPVILRDPAIFMKAAMAVCQLESAGGRTVVVLSKDKDKEKERGKSSTVEVVLPSNESLRIPEMKAHDGTGKCLKGHKKIPANLTQVLDHLLEIVSQFPAVQGQEDCSDYATAMEVDEHATKVKGKTKIGEKKKSESDGLPERSAALARVAFVLKLLSEVLLMYVHAMGVILKRDSELCQLRGSCHVDTPGHGGIVHHVLHRILPFSTDKYAGPTELRNKLSEKASWFLVVLCGRSGEGRRRVISELVKALSLCSNSDCNSDKSSLFPDRKVLALAELVHSILSKHSSTGSSPVSGYSPDMAKSMVDGGIIPCLINILQVMDLDHPDAPKTANLILKALECLTRAANASEQAFKSDVLNKKISTVSQGRSDAENMITESVNGMTGHNQNRVSEQNVADAVENEGHNSDGARFSESVNDVISDTAPEQGTMVDGDGNSATNDVVGLGVEFVREDLEGGAVVHNAGPINVNFHVENHRDDDIGDEDDDMGDDGDEEEDEDEGDDEDEDIAEDGAALMSLADTDVDDHEDTGLGDDYNDDLADEDDDDYHENHVIEVRWREALDGFDHLQVLGQSGSGVIDVSGEAFEGVNVDDLFGLRRSLGFERRHQTTRPSFDRSNTEGGFHHPFLVRPSQSGDMGHLWSSRSHVSRDSESSANGSFDVAQFYMFDAPVRPYGHTPTSLYGDHHGAPALPPLTEFQLAIRRGPGDGRWADDGRPQAGGQASTIAQLVEQFFVSHLRSNVPADPLVVRQSQNTRNEVNQQSGVPESNGDCLELVNHGSDSQHREEHQENYNETEHLQSSPQHEDASRGCVNIEPVAHDGIRLNDPSSLNLDVPDNAEHDCREIGGGNGISSGTLLEGISPSSNTHETLQHEGASQMVANDHDFQMMAPDADGSAGNDSHPANHLTVDSGLMMPHQVDHLASSVDVEMNSTTEPVETEQATPSHGAVVEVMSRENTSHTENANQSDHTASTDQVPGLNAIDPTFLEALPEDLRAEVLASQQSQPVQPSAYTPPSVEDIDPEFLAALPPDIQAEVLAQQRMQRIAQQSEGHPVDMDNATIIATLPADLREEVLLTSSESVLSALPSPLVAEAQMLRDRALSHYQARSLLGSSHGITNRRNGLGFDRHSVIDRGVGLTVGRRVGSSLADHLKEIEGKPLLDANALNALIRLLRLAQPLGKGLLQKLLLNLCAHSATRISLVRLLLDLIRPEAEGLIGGLSVANSQRLYGCPSNVVYGRSQLLDGVPPLVLCRALEVLTYLATNHSTVANILCYFDPSLLSETDIQEYPEIKSDKGKGKIEDGGLSGNAGQGSVPLILLLKLLRRPLFLRSSAHLDQLMGLVQVVVYTAASELENQSLPDPSEDRQDPVINKASDDAQKDVPSAESESRQDSKDADQKSGGSAESSNFQSTKSHDIYSTFLQLPQSELRNLCLLLGHEGLSDKVYMLVGEVLKKLASVASAHSKFFTLELADLAQVLSNSAVGELVTLKNTHMTGLSAGSMAGAAMLRVLQNLSRLASLKGPDGLEEHEDRAIMQMLNTALEPLWKELSECIGTTEMQLGQSSLSPNMTTVSVVENIQGSSHSSAPLPPGTQRLLPFIEAFFVLCEKLQSSNTIAQQDHDDVTVTEAKQSTGCSGSDLTSGGDPQRFNGAITFSRFVEKHRRLLNAFIRQNAGLLEKSLSMMLKAPRLIDFDNKRAHFRSKIRQQHDQHLAGPLRISVRRAYVLEDSYNQLRLRPKQDLRGRLNVQFQGEEGIDAGGLTREWYQLLSRVIFDKGALLFTTVGNNATFQPNPNSVYQTEHLSYFRFVGRVVAKALFDGQLLDVYFTRSFYKHILGVKVTYHDIEAVDPDYYKNLKWMLENDVSDLPDLTFSMDPDEEKHILYEKTEVTDYELKPGGRNIRVTEDTKHEYVDLVADHILTNAIRPQINSFLEGFNELVPKELISIFNGKELELLISGLPEIDLDDLKANTEYTGYTAASNVVQWFWEVVEAFSKEDMARLLQFVTGTSKVPLEGFKALQGIAGAQKFQVHKAYGAPERLPSAHTCFNQLDIPEYTSKEQLQERLLLAIHEASEGFGFG